MPWNRFEPGLPRYKSEVLLEEASRFKSKQLPSAKVGYKRITVQHEALGVSSSKGKSKVTRER